MQLERMEDAQLRAHIQSVVQAKGMTAAVKELGLSRGTIAAYLAGVNTTPGTRALLELAVYRQQGGTRNAM